MGRPNPSRKFVVEVRHSSRSDKMRKVGSLRVDALSGDPGGEDYQPVSDEIPEVDALADVPNPSPFMVAPKIEKSKLDAPSRSHFGRIDVPKSRITRITALEPPPAPSVEKPVLPAAGGRILQNLLSPPPEAPPERPRSTRVTALGQKTNAILRPRRARVDVLGERRPEQAKLNLQPPSVSRTADIWPDDAQIAARRVANDQPEGMQTMPRALTDQPIQDLATARRRSAAQITPSGHPDDLMTPPSPPTRSLRSKRAFHYNTNADRQARRDARLFSPREAAGILPPGERWKRRIPTRIW